MSTFFTSDTHFGAKRTLELSRRPFKNTTEMDKTIIKNWNKIVGKKDIVYHLGDFGNKEIIKKLNGNVVLMLGNYEEDELANRFGGDFDEYKLCLKALGFHDVVPSGVIVKIDGYRYYCTHRPQDCKKDMFNLFGHAHGMQKLKKFGIDVGVDGNFFYPYSVDDIKFWENAVKIHTKGRNVFCDIDNL